jgi:hypothetical protein
MNLDQARELRYELDAIEAALLRIQALWQSDEFPTAEELENLTEVVRDISSGMDNIVRQAEQLPSAKELLSRLPSPPLPEAEVGVPENQTVTFKTIPPPPRQPARVNMTVREPPPRSPSPGAVAYSPEALKTHADELEKAMMDAATLGDLASIARALNDYPLTLSQRAHLHDVQARARKLIGMRPGRRGGLFG